jgi:hypothetical protein
MLVHDRSLNPTKVIICRTMSTLSMPMILRVPEKITLAELPLLISIPLGQAVSDRKLNDQAVVMLLIKLVKVVLIEGSVQFLLVREHS